jgi:hypothetical protein
MKDLPVSIKHLFPPSTDLGRLGTLSTSAGGARAAAQIVLACVGGLKVGATGPGVEQAASDIEFHQAMRQDREIVVRPWRRRLGDLVSVADAHHAHIMLFVDSSASFYAFTDPDGKLYALGRFDQAAEKLLLGLDFGKPLEPDS